MNRPVFACYEPVISRTILIATAGARVSVKLAQRRARQLTIFDLLPLFVCQICQVYTWTTRPGLVGTHTVSIIFSAVSHKWATRQDVQTRQSGSWPSHSRVIVLHTGGGGKFELSGSTSKTRKEQCLRLRRAARSQPVVIGRGETW